MMVNLFSIDIPWLRIFGPERVAAGVQGRGGNRRAVDG